MLPAIVIFFREGLEASLIVSIIIAYLHKIGHTRETRQVWLGVGLAAGLDLAVGLLLYHVIRQYDGSRMQTILEGTTYLIATIMLTGMSFWMKSQGRTMKASMERQIQLALGKGTLFALVGLSFLSVGREGLETVFFTLAFAFHSNPLDLGIGAVIGLGLALAVDWTIFGMGRRVPLTVFFNVLGGLLLVFGAALLADGIEDFQSLGWLPLLTHALWNTGGVLNENSLLGDILHNFIGYAAKPTGLQFGAYVLYLIIGFWRYFRPTSLRSKNRTQIDAASSKI
ncbi:FTR1 family iron permease [Sulfobacillus harzensis]|uniref:High-affinity iron transporter n=1 Tax=Sulfobacillus harzensis TaxID=2729629 RepID=A0A7Y0L1U9_9FIRM|nr:FTR1 family protein [Sulfobacillus harzensis]NMP21743.1 hypothetical protein [Sulfobacillus harzensis]